MAKAKMKAGAENISGQRKSAKMKKEIMKNGEMAAQWRRGISFENWQRISGIGQREKA